MTQMLEPIFHPLLPPKLAPKRSLCSHLGCTKCAYLVAPFTARETRNTLEGNNHFTARNVPKYTTYRKYYSAQIQSNPLKWARFFFLSQIKKQ